MKCVSFNGGRPNVTRDINTWLDDNPNIDIKHINQTPHGGYNYDICVLMFYEDYQDEEYNEEVE